MTTPPTETNTPPPTNTLTSTPTNTPLTYLAAAVARAPIVPNNSYPEEVTRLRVGERVTVLAVSQDPLWWYVRREDGFEGFVLASLLEGEVNVDMLPVREAQLALATAKSLAGIFRLPDGETNFLGIVEPAEQVLVLARPSTGDGWLYVQNANNIIGFVALEKFDWPGDFDLLFRISLNSLLSYRPMPQILNFMCSGITEFKFGDQIPFEWRWEGRLVGDEYLEVRIGPNSASRLTGVSGMVDPPQGSTWGWAPTALSVYERNPSALDLEWEVVHMAADQRTVIGRSERGCIRIRP